MKSIPIGMTLVIVATLTSCGTAEPPKPTRPIEVPLADFGRLRWLEGKWRGAEMGGMAFFEAYHFLNDSTVRSYVFPDSTFTAPTDSSEIRWREGLVTSGLPVAQWFLIRFDSVAAEFAASETPKQGFIWTYLGPGEWKARLRWDSAGKTLHRDYRMKAVR